MTRSKETKADRLPESDERFRRVFDASPMAMFLGDRGQRILQVNPRMCKLLGYSEDELLARTVADITHPDDSRELAEPTRGSPGLDDDRLTREIRLVRSDGSIRWARLTAAVLDRDPLLVMGILEDIHEVKQAEEKLRQVQTQLAHVARLSTLGEMVAQIVHEVSQPLYSILNYAKACGHLLEKSSPDLNRVREWNREIAVSAALAGEVLRKMRNFVRRGPTQRLPTRIEDLMRESVALLAFEFRQHRVALQTSFGAGGLHEVEIDGIQIQQVVVNLLRNAMESLNESHTGTATVWIRTVPSETHLEVIVEDNGPGLPGSDVHLFEPFVTTKSHGLGLGLPISRTIIEAHGGRLWAASSPRGGAAFHFTLPWYEGASHGP